MSSQWGPQPNIPPSSPHKIPGTWKGLLAAVVAVPRQRWQRAWQWALSVATQAAQFANLRHCAMLWVLNPPMEEYLATGWWHLPHRSTKLVLLPVMHVMRP